MTEKEILLESDELSSQDSNDEETPEFAIKDVVGDKRPAQQVSIDEFLVQTGECGRYQILMAILINIAMIPMSFPPLIFYFIGYDPPWTCNKNATHINGTICSKPNSSSLTFQHTVKDRCKLNRNEWIFSNHGKSTLVTEFNLVCDQAWLDALAGSIVFIGWGIGILTLGYLSDRYGRKKIMYPALFLTLLALMAHAFVKDIWQLIIIRFIMGFTYSGPALNNFVLSVELVGPNKRELAATFNSVVWPVGAVIMTMSARYLDNWRYLALVTSIPYMLGIFTVICVPESIRWLSVKGRIEDAEAVLHKAAKFNKKESSNLALASDNGNQPPNKYSYLTLFKKCKLIRLVITQAFIWFNSGMVYYALSWAFSDLGGDIFSNFILSTLIEVPGGLFMFFFLKYWGRKKTTTLVTFLACMCCLVVACLPEDKKTIKVAFGLMGKLAISSAFFCNYIWSTEINATCIRTQGMGINIVTSRIGAATSPFIKLLHRLHPAAPFSLMFMTSFVASLLCLTLPETHRKPTRETLQDMLGENDKTYTVMYSMAGEELAIQSHSSARHRLLEEDEEEEEEDRNSGEISIGEIRT